MPGFAGVNRLNISSPGALRRCARISIAGPGRLIPRREAKFAARAGMSSDPRVVQPVCHDRDEVRIRRREGLRSDEFVTICADASMTAIPVERMTTTALALDAQLRFRAAPSRDRTGLRPSIH